MKMTAQEYARRVQKAGPHSPLLADCLWAFCVGGGICLLGEWLRQLFLRQGADAEAAGTLTSCTLILLSAVLTATSVTYALSSPPQLAFSPASPGKISSNDVCSLTLKPRCLS